MTRQDRRLGLDIETTGTDVNSHELIQIGVYDPISEDRFVLDVGHDVWLQNEESMKVTGFTEDRIRTAPRSEVVDALLTDWLGKHGIGAMDAVPVGFSVGQFDMPFVRKTLPTAATRIGWRSIDLNAVAFTVEDVTGIDPAKMKRKASKFAEEQGARRGWTPRWHDAGWDAYAAWNMYLFFRQFLQTRQRNVTLADLP